MERKCKRWYFVRTPLLFISWLALVSPAYSQAPAIQWQKNFGGSNYDQASSIQQTTDGGYIMAGTTLSSDNNITLNHGLNDCWVVKINSTGDIEWQKTYGGSNDESAFCIRQTADGGYIFIGTTLSVDGDVTSNHGMSDFWVVKLNSTGAIEWQNTYGGTNFDEGFSIEQTLDGGYVVTGSTQSADGDVTFNHGIEDFWLIKLSSLGSIQWQKTYGGNNADRALQVGQTSDGGYIIAGQSRTPNNGDVSGNHSGSEDYWIVKTNSSGTIEWENSFGGDDVENPHSISQTSDGGYIIAGGTYSVNGDVTLNHGTSDYWIVKINSAGSIEWQKTYGGGDYDVATSIRQTPDGGYIVAGVSDSNDGDITGDHASAPAIGDYWIVKLNGTGNIQWQKALGGTSDDRAFCAQTTSDGGYIITGFSQSNDGDVTGNYGLWDFWTVKLLNVALPAELISFTARLVNKTVDLNWQTAQEIDNAGFELQRSSDGINFIKLAFIASKALNGNSSSPLTYTTDDVNPFNGSTYYRLKQLDIDGKFTYSKILLISAHQSGEINIVNVFPNPVMQNLSVQIFSPIEKTAWIVVINSSGQTVMKKEVNLLAGNNNFQLPVSLFARGEYLLKLSCDYKCESRFKFVKQ